MQVLKELAQLWAKTNYLVAANSFFASVQMVPSLHVCGLFYMCGKDHNKELSYVVRTSTTTN